MTRSLRTPLLVGAVSAFALSACAGPAPADGGDFTPTGDMTMVVPFSAGGGSDLAGRATAAGLEGVSDDLTMTVENRDGGSGSVGYSYFLSREGDPSYVLATETALLALPLSQDVEFDYTDFTPIAQIAEDFTMMVVPSDSPYETCADVVEEASSERVVAGISGITGLDNFVLGLTEDETDAEFDRVPFESGSELLAALLGGQVDIASLNPGEVIGQIEAGDVKPLCVFAEERYDYEELADVETAQEQGVDVSFAQFRGLIAPGGITDEERDGWVTAMEDYTESDAYDEYIASNYLQPTTAFGDDFTAYLDENNETLQGVIE